MENFNKVLSNFELTTGCGKQIQVRVYRNLRTQILNGVVKHPDGVGELRYTFKLDPTPDDLYRMMLLISDVVNIMDDTKKFKL